ncbi:MAG: helix-turn-helix transcriptional regulator [Gemmatimonadetes bacterium]|nr:helix-turn-helix transcriptional regulator [Gemmatimonadota bacterium]
MLDLASVLPLSRSQLYLLLAIQEGERHGYAVKKRVEELSGGVVRMGPGTLYTAIQRAEEQGLIEESDERPPEAEDQSQRRYYRVTALGREALLAEVDRLGDFVASARSALSEA